MYHASIISQSELSITLVIVFAFVFDRMNLCDTFEKNVISSPSPSSGMLSSSASLEFWSITCWNVEARVGKKSDMAQPGNSLPVVGLAVALFTLCLGSLRLVDNQSLNNQTTVLPPKAIFWKFGGQKSDFWVFISQHRL